MLGLPMCFFKTYLVYIHYYFSKEGISMKLINSAVTTLEDAVAPAALNECPNCLDACLCIDCKPSPVNPF